jgi:hypothetical protein
MSTEATHKYSRKQWRLFNSLTKKLRKLRLEHTNLACAEKWQQMQTCGLKIIALLNQITREFPDFREQCFADIDGPTTDGPTQAVPQWEDSQK